MRGYREKLADRTNAFKLEISSLTDYDVYPLLVLTDGSVQFTSGMFKMIMYIHGTTHIYAFRPVSQMFPWCCR